MHRFNVLSRDSNQQFYGIERDPDNGRRYRRTKVGTGVRPTQIARKILSAVPLIAGVPSVSPSTLPLGQRTAAWASSAARLLGCASRSFYAHRLVNGPEEIVELFDYLVWRWENAVECGPILYVREHIVEGREVKGREEVIEGCPGLANFVEHGKVGPYR